LFVPVKKSSKKSGEASLSAAVPPVGYTAKFLPKSFTAFRGAHLGSGGCPPGCFENSDIIRYMLLFLILFLMLPRGIPVKHTKKLNINFAFPVFIYNKAGIFRLLTECKGSVK
jgi:hypothetical protein